MAGKIRSLRLVVDHDVRYLDGKWGSYLRDPDPGLVAFVLDLLLEAPSEEAIRLLQYPPDYPQPKWLLSKWSSTKEALETAAR